MLRPYSKLLLVLTVLLFPALLYCQTPSSSTGVGWPTYGGDPGGQRYSNAAQITRANVAGLRPVWTYHTHALESGSLAVSRSDFEATPILFHGLLYLSTPFDRVIALDPETGAERWTYDPHLAKDLQATNYTSRGVASWAGSSGTEPCSRRIFVATLDARLIAVDANDGQLCTGFGVQGQVDLRTGVPTNPRHPYLFFGNTSPATVVGDTVVVGSAVPDNQAVDVEAGLVRGFDARSGRLLWTWDPMPWAEHQTPRTGAANAWSTLAADPPNHLVFVPTGAPSPDFYGGLRLGDDKDANSLVALDARDGHKVWAFQVIHHDVWDYDIASEPLLFTYHGNVPAIAIAPKTGVVFVFNRLTGEPLYPIEERPVPASDVPGEHLSPTQPFSSLPPLNPLTFDPQQLTGHDAASTKTCQATFARLRYQGIFTPPSLQGSVQYPGSFGGVNWSSMSIDPRTGILYANVDHSTYEIRLLPPVSRIQILLLRRLTWVSLAALVLCAAGLRRRSLFPGWFALALALIVLIAGSLMKNPDRFTFQRRHNVVNSPDSVGEISPNFGAPYRIYRRVIEDDDGHPCTPTPWGATAALNLSTGKFLWQLPLGTLVPGQHTGTVSLGAPIVTAGGLLFTGASTEPLLRAIDKTTGEEVWSGKLPVPALSTPMTYTLHGRQFVVIAAGGHGGLGTPLSDAVVAFALPEGTK